MARKRCLECGKSNAGAAKFCNYCSKPLNPAESGACGETPTELFTEGAIPDPKAAPDDSAVAKEAEPAAVTAPEVTPAEEAAAPVALEPKESHGYALEVLSGLSAGMKARIFDGESVLVGAGDAADMRIAGDENLSRRHASFSVHDGQLWIRDEDSTNGTFLSVKRLVALQPGDAVVLGSTLLRVRGKE